MLTTDNRDITSDNVSVANWMTDKGRSYLLGRGVRNSIGQVIKVVNGLKNGVIVQVEIAQRMYNTGMETKQTNDALTNAQRQTTRVNIENNHV